MLWVDHGYNRAATYRHAEQLRHQRQGRDRLVARSPGFQTRRSQEQLSLAEVERYAAHEPGRFSPNVLLRPAGGARYGTTNTVEWAGDARTVTVTVTAGFTVLGNETVIPSAWKHPDLF